MKACTQCEQTKALNSFRPASKGKDGLHTWCRACERKLSREYSQAHKPKRAASQSLYRKRHPAKVNANNGRRRAAQLNRTPAWLSPLQKQHAELFYIAAKSLSKELGQEFQVDHIVPLQGENVSGLHVPWNLQVLPAAENASKKNRFAV